MKKFNIKVDGVMHEVEVEEVGGSVASASFVQTSAPVEAPVSQGSAPKVAKSAGSVTAPLQGTIQNMKVNVGDKVNAGDVVCVIEAMKMENDVPATTSGTVKTIYAKNGDKVSSGDVILDIA